MRNAALDCGSFCVNALIEGLDFVAMPQQVDAFQGWVQACNRQPQITTTKKKPAIWLSSLALPEPILRTIMTILEIVFLIL
jgi:hypothetical protein